MINNIERHVVEAGEHVETAKLQTKKAIKYQKKARVVRKKYFYSLYVLYLINVDSLGYVKCVW